MKPVYKPFLFILLFYGLNAFSQGSDADASNNNTEEVSHTGKSAEELERSRNLGLNFGYIGALIGVICVALAFNYNVRKATRLNKELIAEKQKSENLLLNILPAEVALELKETGTASAKSIDDVSVLFTDFKDFTKIAEQLSAAELVEELNSCFKAFDIITEKYHIEKIKVIGDSYMAAGGLTGEKASALNTIMAALEMQEYIEKRKAQRQQMHLPVFSMRAGIHTGHVTAGVVGSKKFQYDIWGDTVNIASRMESSGEPGRVNISQTTYSIVQNNNDLIFENRGAIPAKNKDEITMYFAAAKLKA
jgi:adenylate cyclase